MNAGFAQPDLAALRGLRRGHLILELALDDLLQRDVRVPLTRPVIHHRTMPLGELPNSLRDDVDEDLLV